MYSSPPSPRKRVTNDHLSRDMIASQVFNHLVNRKARHGLQMEHITRLIPSKVEKRHAHPIALSKPSKRLPTIQYKGGPGTVQQRRPAVRSAELECSHIFDNTEANIPCLASIAHVLDKG